TSWIGRCSRGRQPLIVVGAGSENRTRTLLPEPDFESGASTSSAIPAARAQYSSPGRRPSGAARCDASAACRIQGSMSLAISGPMDTGVRRRRGHRDRPRVSRFIDKHIDPGIVARAARGDARAHEILYRAFAPAVYSLCLRFTRVPAHAEDLTQD